MLETSGSREVKVKLFEKVVVRISDVMERSTYKRKVKLELVSVGGK